MEISLLLAFGLGIAVLLILILALKINAFVSLLISSITVGLAAGMDAGTIVKTVTDGMGGTLGYISIVIGLGAIFGEILRESGSTEKLSAALLKKFGVKNSPIALSITGFIIAIPVFFDVAFIILMPVLYGLQKKTKKSLLFFAIPLLASLAITHAFIPPTPGPIAVAELINADLGWVILFGIIVGVPVTIISGIIFGRFISNKIYVPVPEHMDLEDKRESGLQSSTILGAPDKSPPLWGILGLIAIPIVLIVLNTVANATFENKESLLYEAISFLGNPIIALIISVMFAWLFLGVMRGFSLQKLQDLSVKALGPAGIIILITGAGGVFKQMLVTTGAGEMLATEFAKLSITPILLAFLLALIVRLLQGSATVAMITAAGIMAPIIENMGLAPAPLALMVLAIAAGASGFSHVNDSGFWLVNRYLGMTELDTMKSWTAMTGILSVSAIVIILILSLFVA